MSHITFPRFHRIKNPLSVDSASSAKPSRIKALARSILERFLSAFETPSVPYESRAEINARIRLEQERILNQHNFYGGGWWH